MAAGGDSGRKTTRNLERILPPSASRHVLPSLPTCEKMRPLSEVGAAGPPPSSA